MIHTAPPRFAAMKCRSKALGFEVIFGVLGTHGDYLWTNLGPKSGARPFLTDFDDFGLFWGYFGGENGLFWAQNGSKLVPNARKRHKMALICHLGSIWMGWTTYGEQLKVNVFKRWTFFTRNDQFWPKMKWPKNGVFGAFCPSLGVKMGLFFTTSPK